MRNPHLPEAPASGRHDFGENERRSGRCLLCGAYQGSPEAVSICKGEYKESGKMRHWAAEKWTQERLRGEHPQLVIEYITRRGRAFHMPGFLMSPGTSHFVRLDCGCENEIKLGRLDTTHDEFELGMSAIRLLENDRLEYMSCTNTSCVMQRMREHAALNNKNYNDETKQFLKDKGVL